MEAPRAGWYARVAAALVGVAAVVVVCERIPNVNETTVALVLLLEILAIASRWGLAAALIASAAAGMAFDYFFLPPYGLGIQEPQHWVAFSAFIITAVVTSRYSTLLKQREREAAQRREEIEKLYRVGATILQGDNFSSTIEHIIRASPAIFGVSCAAFWNARDGAIVRVHVGGRDDAGCEEALRRAAAGTPAVETCPAHADYSIAPVRVGDQVMGSIGFAPALPPHVLQSVANLVAIGLARAQALEEAARLDATRRSEELRVAVLDALAHDLRTPLTSIKAAVTALLRALHAQKDDDRELLTIINEEADRLNALAGQAVEMARVAPGLVRPEKQTLDLRGFITECLGALRPVLRGRQVRCQFDDGLRSVDGDPRLIAEVLKQLIDNAVKYSPDASPIGVACRNDGDRIVVQVADSGPGVPPHDRQAIFEKFYRSAGVLGTPGTGIGLAISRSIVLAHDGDIWMENRPEGGSLFQFSLPFSKTSQELASHP